MSYANPTPLRLGATGVLGGQRFRVAGRVVMGMDDEGETYYWNEFNLVDDAGGSATLVFEETESGSEWRLFTLFEPSHPLTANEAAAKSVGDQVDLDGQPMPVTLVDQSRVYFIEGTPPEGVEVGDIADYFNVESGNQMLVVSWTGDEVECYQGITVPAETITEAFNLPKMPALAPALSIGRSLSAAGGAAESMSYGWMLKLIVFAVVIGAWFFASRPTGWRSAAPLTKPSPPAAAFALGASGTLRNWAFTVAGRATVEIAKVGALYDCREYELTRVGGGRALLVCGLSGNAKEWHLMIPFTPAEPPTPFEAAAKRAGDTVTLDGSETKVQELFRAKWLSHDGAAGADLTPGAVRFGFLARRADHWVMGRWNEKETEFYIGLTLKESDTLAAFSRVPGP
ncbi:MAG: DUF4178 domain-containing protein [Verrucomicrobia bacterium]|nr:DUF4178 domain-containing protein [Verrucomicrobiota bacterium]